jgi:hypothetical protein
MAAQHGSYALLDALRLPNVRRRRGASSAHYVILLASQVQSTARDCPGPAALQVLLHGRLLMRWGDDRIAAPQSGPATSGPAGGGWSQAFVVLTEEALLWLQPPQPAWRGVALTHAVPQPDSSASHPLAEVFELSTSRHTLRFRCRSAAAR